MRLVDNDVGLVALRQIDNLFERRPVTVHAEERFRDDEHLAPFRTLGGFVLKAFFQVVQIVVPKRKTSASRQAQSIDNAGMVQLVARDAVARLAESGDQPFVGRKATSHHQHGFTSVPYCQLFFNLVPKGVMATEQT
jgi:hypothetical protein